MHNGVLVKDKRQRWRSDPPSEEKPLPSSADEPLLKPGRIVGKAITLWRYTKTPAEPVEPQDWWCGPVNSGTTQACGGSVLNQVLVVGGWGMGGRKALMNSWKLEL